MGWALCWNSAVTTLLAQREAQSAFNVETSGSPPMANRFTSEGVMDCSSLHPPASGLWQSASVFPASWTMLQSHPVIPMGSQYTGTSIGARQVNASSTSRGRADDWADCASRTRNLCNVVEWA